MPSNRMLHRNLILMVAVARTNPTSSRLQDGKLGKCLIWIVKGRCPHAGMRLD